MNISVVYIFVVIFLLSRAPLGAEKTVVAQISPQTTPTAQGSLTEPRAPIQLSAEQRQMIGVTYGTVERTILKKTIRAVGRVEFDERRLTDVTFKVGGWVQDLFIDYTGKSVRKGEPLLTLYSPDLVASQEEYLLAFRSREQLAGSAFSEVTTSSQKLLEAARRRLLLWDLTSQQLTALEKRGTPQTYLTLHAPVSGVVVEKTVVKGMRIEPGMQLYRIADLSTVWFMADIYEHEVPLAREGQEVAMTLSYYPGETFKGRIAYIFPYLDSQTRTNRVRLEFPNPRGKLKPGMYANSVIEIDLGDSLVIPASAVLQSGQRQLVFVDQGQGVLSPREVILGVKTDAHFVVLAGLTAGERIVTSGNFLLDSESKLQSAASMMGMMGAIGMGDWKMESARPMAMNAPPTQTGPIEKQIGSLAVTVSTAPEAARLGENILRVQIRDNAGRPVTDATVSLEYTMDMPGMMIDKANTTQASAGVYEALVRFAMTGPWGVTVSIQRSGEAEVRGRFVVGVSS